MSVRVVVSKDTIVRFPIYNPVTDKYNVFELLYDGDNAIWILPDGTEFVTVSTETYLRDHS